MIRVMICGFLICCSFESYSYGKWIDKDAFLMFCASKSSVRLHSLSRSHPQTNTFKREQSIAGRAQILALNVLFKHFVMSLPIFVDCGSKMW
jgi:hypothetical protein